MTYGTSHLLIGGRGGEVFSGGGSRENIALCVGVVFSGGGSRKNAV